MSINTNESGMSILLEDRNPIKTVYINDGQSEFATLDEYYPNGIMIRTSAAEYVERYTPFGFSDGFYTKYEDKGGNIHEYCHVIACDKEVKICPMTPEQKKEFKTFLPNKYPQMGARMHERRNSDS